MKKNGLVVMVLVGLALSAYATGSNFGISSEVHSTLSISCVQYDGSTAYGTWSVGSKALSTAATMTTAQGVMIKNTSTVAVTLSAAAAATAAWTAGSDIGANTYKLELKTVPSIPGSVDMSGAAVVTAGTGLGSLGTADGYVFARVTFPSASTTATKQNMTVTITAGVE